MCWVVCVVVECVGVLCIVLVDVVVFDELGCMLYCFDVCMLEEYEVGYLLGFLSMLGG